jgi:1,6-anhydro-N-acetylmuramate kinase
MAVCGGGALNTHLMQRLQALLPLVPWSDARSGQRKLEPQPQVVVAFGFLITNWAPCRSSL